MTSPVSWRRRLAEALARHAVRVMPGELTRWATAIESELAWVGDDWAAVRWAVGGLGAAYRARMRHLRLLDFAAFRACGVLLVLFRAFDVTLPSVMTTAYTLGSLGLTEGLGRMTPGDDYQRLIPLMEAIPLWLHVVLVAAGACYLVAALCLLVRRPLASPVLVAAVGAELVSHVLSKPILAPVGVTVTPDQSVLASVLLPVVFPLLLAAAAWSSGRRPDSDPLQA